MVEMLDDLCRPGSTWTHSDAVAAIAQAQKQLQSEDPLAVAEGKKMMEEWRMKARGDMTKRPIRSTLGDWVLEHLDMMFEVAFPIDKRHKCPLGSDVPAAHAQRVKYAELVMSKLHQCSQEVNSWELGDDEVEILTQMPEKVYVLLTAEVDTSLRLPLLTRKSFHAVLGMLEANESGIHEVSFL